MRKYIDAEKLIAEIERYGNTAIDAYNPLGGDADFWQGKVVACEDLKTLVTSLQQEQPCDTCTNDKGCVTCKDGELWEGKEQPSEDLEKAADEYSNENEYMEVGFCVEPIYIGHKTEKAFIAGAEWQKEQMIRDCSVQASYEAEIEKAEERGYNLCKEQMLKDAEECDLYYDGDFLAIDLNMATLGYSERDKVKIVVVKEG